ncbi:hypothetical protein GOODEAATRI_016354 [Goodea atripinnis]|uniref:Uncharacterized protein n=1 Tax=Goodea atripinnis TaxID=208336 RepID=A0ABV0MSJ3_9TELE
MEAVKYHQAKASLQQRSNFDVRANHQNYSKEDLVWVLSKVWQRGLCPEHPLTEGALGGKPHCPMENCSCSEVYVDGVNKCLSWCYYKAYVEFVFTKNMQANTFIIKK